MDDAHKTSFDTGQFLRFSEKEITTETQGSCYIQRCFLVPLEPMGSKLDIERMGTPGVHSWGLSDDHRVLSEPAV
jgi:hypothetical protein